MPNPSAPLSVRLYSLREEAAADFPAVIERLGQIGFIGVEPAGLHGLPPREFRRRVEAAGMTVSSSHIQLPIGESAAEILDLQQEIGAEDLVVAFLPPDRFADREQISVTADQLNRAYETVASRGMRLGYHNHNWEFSTKIDDQPAHALLFEQLEPEIFAEIDVYWAQVGGADPVQVVSNLGSRARLLHLKDGPADGPKSPMTAAGGGVIDLAGIAAAADQAAWHIVELDHCATDMFEAVEQSYRYLVAEGISKGRHT
ncbi:MAG: sugar phosphate isomerase/epimerase [Myxococcota bacterium]